MVPTHCDDFASKATQVWSNQQPAKRTNVTETRPLSVVGEAADCT
jgi:hypothetical protein